MDAIEQWRCAWLIFSAVALVLHVALTCSRCARPATCATTASNTLSPGGGEPLRKPNQESQNDEGSQ